MTPGESFFRGAHETPPSEERHERMGPQTARALHKFQRFATEQQALIEKRAKSGESYEDIFYDLFYSQNQLGQEHRKTDPDYQRMKEKYDREAQEVLRKFLAFAEKHRNEPVPGISAGEQSIKKGWVYFKVNGGAKRDGTLGRFYLNIDPERLPAFYEEILPDFFRERAGVDAKISGTASPQDFNRQDKMVIYFNAAEEDQVLAIIERKYKENPGAFLKGIPRFTAEICDDHGFVMEGVGFGEEPAGAGGKSFGDVRSKILAEVYEASQRDGYPLSDPKSLEAFRKACEHRGVDPSNAAFNLSEADPPPFYRMRKRENEVLRPERG